jgi:wobble nucleotide-excising tRNase
VKIDAFLALPSAENVDTLITEQQKRVETARQADAIKDRKALSEFPLPDLPARFEQVLGVTIDIAADAEAKLATHIAAHGMADGGGNWIAEGLEHARDTCPFCGQGISGSELIAAFRSVFSERYEALATEISAMTTLVSQLFGDTAFARLETLAEQNKSSAEFWAKYVDVDAPSLDLPVDIFTAAARMREVALEFLAKKAGTPLEALRIDARFTTAVASYDTARAAVTAANKVIQTTNTAIAAKKVATGVADLKAEEAELGRLKACKVRHTPAVATLCDAHGALVTAKDLIDKQKDAARAALDAHTRTVVKPYQVVSTVI